MLRFSVAACAIASLFGFAGHGQQSARGAEITHSADQSNDQSASSRYEKKDPEEFARWAIAKDREHNGKVKNEPSNSTGASEGVEGRSGDGWGADPKF